MTYEKTGKPPGRPRKDGLPAGSVPEAPAAEPMRSPFDMRPMPQPGERADRRL